MALEDSLPQINLGVPGWALDWFEVLGYRVVDDKATDYARLKQTLTEQFPVIYKILKLEMTEEKLIDHVISRLEPQILDYVEKDQSLELGIRDTNPSESNRFPNRNQQENWRETRGNNRYSDNSRPRREFNRFEGQDLADNRRFDGRRRGGQSDHRFYNEGGRQGGSRNSSFREGTIRPIQSPYTSPVVLKRKNNGLPPDSAEVYRFAIGYRKLNAITKYPRYPLPVIDNLITNIPHTGLTLNKEKRHFARDKLKYLGLIISKEGIGTDNSKVKTIAEMKPPKNSKEVSKFLGMAGWYQKFIPHYADICKPLYRLKKKGAKLNWLMEAQEAFNKVKGALTEAPVLQLPNFKEQFNLFTDASGVGIGAVPNQNHEPIAFTSRTLNKAERNYTVKERECLAVIWTLNKFKTYFGSLPVKHRPGVQNAVAGVLSRNPVGNMDGSQISCAALQALALNSREQLLRQQREDPELGHIYRYLENPDDGSVNATVCENRSQDFKLIDGLLFYAKYSTTLGELRVYIRRSLHEAIMQEFHDLPLAGHLGKRKTYLKLRYTCYFPYMRKYIFEYVSTCDRCQKFNYRNVLPAGRLIPIVSNYPNEFVTLDLLGPYPAFRPKR
ncbi:retrovirus-related Pol polyprotein from transposon 297 [Trichonephila clavipes]|nr:retrovirus-related Pol polyprotein from transposon 297 [Trichonephila clavipes]